MWRFKGFLLYWRLKLACFLSNLVFSQ